MTFDQDTFDEKLAIAMSETDKLQRLVTLGQWDTAGPDPHPDIVDIIPPPHPEWVGGWWEHAKQRPAHPKRIGGPISPFARVWHTCDEPPEDLGALLDNITKEAGKGNAFHFVIGPSETDGTIQCVPINRNANHAGGPEHGVFVDFAGREYHPNLVTLGIEFMNAGRVRRIANQWRFVEDGKIHGRPLADDQVTLDPSRPGFAWHRLTPYQVTAAAMLKEAIEPLLAPLPKGLIAKSRFETPATWAAPRSARDVGHVTLDAKNRSDPWPPGMEIVRRL